MFQKQWSHAKVRSSLIKINEALIKPLTRLQYPIMVLTFLWYVISKQPGHVLKKKKKKARAAWLKWFAIGFHDGDENSPKLFWNVVLRDDLKWNCKLDKHDGGSRHIPMSRAADRLWRGLAVVRSFKSSRRSGLISELKKQRELLNPAAG